RDIIATICEVTIYTNRGDQHEREKDIEHKAVEAFYGPLTIGRLKRLGAEVQKNANLLRGQGASKEDSILNFHYNVAILCKPYMELHTSKLDNLGSPGKLRQIPTTYLFWTQPSLTICSVKALLGANLDNMANNDKPLKELTTPDIMYQPWCNTQQFGVRESTTSRVVNEITELTSLVRRLAIGQHHISPLVRVCDICTSLEHPIDAFSTLQETKLNNGEVATMMDDFFDFARSEKVQSSII
ncbi:hypothetical protein CR513_19082, partial [Mucuna pruriens]